MKSFVTNSKSLYILLLFIFSISYSYSQTVSGITGTFSSGAGNAADANGSYSPNGTISGKNSWKHVGSSSTFYIYWDNSLGTDYWILDNNTNVTDDAIFFIQSSASTPPSTGWQPGLIDNTSLPTLSGFSNVTITGNAGIAGATLSWTDGSAKTTTADGSGNYTVSVSSGFTGTVTPSLTGYTFSPTNKSYTGITSNQTSQNYTATAITYTIHGSTVPGTTLSWTDGTAKTTTSDISGNYTITVSYNWSGTVTPSQTGYTYSPASRTYTNVLANQTGQDYGADVSISGNAGTPGATLSWTDGSSKTTTADGSGNYSLNVSYGFVGIITPSAAGFTFSPTETNYFTVTTPQTNQNYTATAITYTISGNAGIAGATLSWTDGSAKTTTADGSGNYSLTVSYNFSGTVTPSLAGYTFSPTNKSYTNVLANQTSQNYTATAITYTISGNAGVAGATLSWTDGSAKTTTADGSGNYSFTVSYNFTGTVTPSLTGYTFTPTSKSYTNVLANQTSQNYSALVTISGNAGVAGATLSWTDGSAKTTTADGSGNYSFAVSYNFTGTVTPSKAGFTFSPVNKSYTNILVDQANQNYTATAITYTISGNTGVAGATLSWTDGSAKTATADGSGNYSFTVSYNFTGTVTPSLAGYTFSPTNKSYTNVLADQTSQNYTATAITYTISGNAGIAGATLSWTDGSAKTATADGSGNYSFTVSYNWSGTVTPSLTGYTFSPVNKTYTNVLADQTSQNYTATAITYTISGNAGIPNTVLSWTDGSAKTTTADGSGNYSFTVSYNWTGTVTPSLTGYTFSPANKSYTNVLADQTNQNYTGLVTISGNTTAPGATLSWTDGTAKTITTDGSGNYTITVSYNFSGTVTPSLSGFVFSPLNTVYTNVTSHKITSYSAVVTISGNAVIPGVTLSWNDGSSKTTTTDGSGNYSLTVSYGYTGGITPSAAGYTFTPTHLIYFNVSTPQTNQNFETLVTISGNAGIPGATLSWTDGTAKTTTADGSGNYSFTVSYNWTGTVTPSLTGFSFSPANKSYTNVTANQANQNYTALVTISGNSGIAGATLSWTDGTAKTATADGSGNYSFTVSYNWTGTVTPSLTGYSFSPANKSYTNLLVNQTNQNYTALITISGNAGAPGVTLSWTDGSAKTTTADGSGNYSFTVTYNWTGTVTPSLTGYTFSPANKSYTNLLVNQTNQNYTALVTISGNAGIAGATLSWTDGTAKTSTADGSGNYSFTVTYNWTGTVTPSLTGYTFSPANKSYTNLLVNQTNQNYTALIAISGNAGIAGATLSWTDGTAKTTTADGSGNYSFTVSYNWTGTVTPSLTGYLFTPVNKTYTLVTSNQINQNYTALVTISGNAGIAGATLSWTDGTAKTTTADGSGNYSFTVTYNWTGTVTPSLTGYTFSPANKSYTNLLVNQTNQNYTALVTISGNALAPGVTLSWIDGSAKTTTSDGSGNYSFTVTYNWSGTVTPSLTGLIFTPVSKAYANATVNQINQNYTALVTISGNTGIAGVTLSWIDGTAKTTTADGGGNYSFTVPYNWTGTVVPSLTGFTFTPASITYTNVHVNQTNQNYNTLVIIDGNAGIPGATLSWTDGVAKSTTADSKGIYGFTVAYGWSGKVTPSSAGYSFTPQSKSYSSIIANQVNQNYTALVTISGNTGVGGTVLTWTDSTAKTITSDSTGKYSFTVPYNWSGQVTVSKTGYTFVPTNKSYVNILTNQTNQNYAATAITFTVSGNAGIGGAVLKWTDGTAKTDTADASGNYTFIVSYNWSGTVTPTKTGFNFNPVSKSYTNIILNQINQNYTATAITFTVSGNAGIAGGVLSWTDGTAKTDTADINGNYSITVSYNWSGAVTPSKTGYIFNPVNRIYTSLLSNQVNQNYSAAAITFRISGNTGVDGVTLTWHDGTDKTATSDNSGNYSFTVSYNWSGNVNASKLGFTFNPVNKTYSSVLSDQLNQNYSESISFAPLAKAAVQIANNNFTADWTKVDGIPGYGIDVATDSNFTNILASYKNLDVDTNSTKKIAGLNAGTKYYFRVRGYYHSLFSSYSNIISVTTLLNTPTNLTALYDTPGIRLNWDYDFDSTNVTGFVIFREGGPGGSTKILKIASLSPIDTANGHVTTYLDKTAVEGYAYNYSVSAYNLNGIISSIGGSGGIISKPVIMPLDKPVNLTGIAQPGGKIVLFWKNKSATETGTIIQRSVADSANFREIARTSAADTTYTDSTLQSGLKYFYRVAAYRDTIVSGFSNTINVTNALTGLTDLLYGIPKEYQLYQNYPNPFNPTTQIRFALPKASRVNITIYNILGARVEQLYEGDLNAGYHEVHFDASKLSSGIYLYRIIAGTYTKVLKMVMIK